MDGGRKIFRPYHIGRGMPRPYDCSHFTVPLFHQCSSAPSAFICGSPSPADHDGGAIDILCENWCELTKLSAVFVNALQSQNHQVVIICHIRNFFEGFVVAHHQSIGTGGNFFVCKLHQSALCALTLKVGDMLG